MKCECTDPFHDSDDGCKNEAAEYKDVKVSPELCTPCLFGCELDRRSDSEILGPCGCVDYHYSDCPIRTAAIDNLDLQEYNEEQENDAQED